MRAGEEYTVCVRRALLADTPHSYLERSSIQLLAYSLARSLIPVYLWPMPAYRERFLLNLRGRSIYTSAQFREAASRESAALSGRPQREETRYVNVNVKRGRVAHRASRLRGIVMVHYNHGGLSFSPPTPSASCIVSFSFLCSSRTRAIIIDGAENANFDYFHPETKKLNTRVFIVLGLGKYSVTRSG